MFYKTSTNTTTYLMAVLDGGVGKIYYSTGGAWTLSSITAGTTNRYYFTTFNDIVYLANGDTTNYMQQSADGITWANGANCIDEPVDFVMRRRDRLIASDGDVWYISQPITDAGVVDWTANAVLGSGSFQLAPFDGGYSSGAVQVGRYLFLGKTNGIYRLDIENVAVTPDSMFHVGPAFEECFVECGGRAYFFTVGRRLYELSPNGINDRFDDRLDVLLRETQSVSHVRMGASEDAVYIYLGQITLKEQVYSNFVIKYDVSYGSFSFYDYPFAIERFAKNPITNDIFAVGGNKMYKLESGDTDPGRAISYRQVFHDINEGSYANDLTLSDFVSVYSSGAYNSSIKITDHLGNTSPSSRDTEVTHTITEDLFSFQLDNWSGKYFVFEWFGIWDSGKPRPILEDIIMNIDVDKERKSIEYVNK